MRTRIIGRVALVVLAACSAVTLVSAWQQRQTAECLNRQTEATQVVLRERTKIAGEDRDNLTRLIVAVTEATRSEQSRAALRRYLDVQAANDARREKLRLPELGSESCV